MKVPRTIMMLLIIAAIAIGFGIGCRNPFTQSNTINPRKLHHDTILDEPRPIGEPRLPLSTKLIAGKTQDVGTVDIWLDGDCLKVQYTLNTTAWSLVETHLDVVADTAEFPQTSSGNPLLGKFAYKMTHDPGTATKVYDVSLDGFENATTLYFPAHAEVERCDYDRIVTREGAWAEGYEFPGTNWATYFAGSLPLPYKPPLHWTHYDQEDGLSTYPSQATN